MAIRDLLWRCPDCGLEHGLRPGRGGEVCAGCGTVFRRGAGSTIRAIRAGKPAETLSSSEWLERLEQVDMSTLATELTSSWRGELRLFEGEVPVRAGGRFLGYSERLGKSKSGQIALREDRLEFESDAGKAWSWPLDEITGLQPSSDAVQIKVKGQQVFALAIPDASRRFWEDRLTDAIRRRRRSTGRPEIREFQPRIC